MNFLLQPLTLVTFFPLLGVLVLLFLKPEQKNAARWIALVTSLITFAISIAVLVQFRPKDPALQMVIDLPWIQAAGLNIHLLHGCGWLEHLAPDADHILNPHLDPIHLDRR